MTDFYKECLVKKVLSSKERVVRYLIWGAISFVGALLLFFSFVSSLARITFLIGAAVLLLEKMYWNKFLYKLSFSVEYEYTLTNTTLDVDKIIAKAERSRMLSFDLKEITLVTPLSAVTPAEFDGNFRTVADACADITDMDNTYCLFADTERYGTLRLTLTPNESMLSAMAPLLGRRFRK